MKIIPFNNLKHEYLKFKEEYDAAIQDTLSKGIYILGSELKRFEDNFSKFIGTNFCIGLNSGLDALIFALKALGIGRGDEVIVPANTYIATVIAISEIGATPVLVEPDEFYNIDPDLIPALITNKTKAIMVVHLYGQSARMREIKAICNQYSLFLVEDCAQSHGSKFDGITTGTWGDVSCFSFYPTKNLGAFGDGGACLTNNKEIADHIRLLRNYGSKIKYHNEIIGMNSRLDELQAAILNVKLSHLEEILNHRSMIANRYLKMIVNPKVFFPLFMSIHHMSGICLF
jgi:dTDP-4-amino-4,6-dideoxygalactose transaminase